VAAGIPVIDKSGVRPAEHIVGDGNPVKNIDAVLQGHMVPDNRPFLDITPVTDIAVRPNNGPALNIGKSPYPGSLPDPRLRADQRGGMLKDRFAHSYWTSITTGFPF
jgi:hypothetical protein